MMKLKQILLTTFSALCMSSAFSQPAVYDANSFESCYKNDSDANSRFDCFKEIEKKILTANPNAAKREDGKICILTKAEPTCFENNLEESDEAAFYYYVGQLSHWPDIAVVRGNHWEWSTLRFISNINGTELSAVGFLDITMSLSPNDQYMAFALNDLETGSFDNGVWIFAVDGESKWIELWSVKDEHKGYTYPRWISDDQLVVSIVGFKGDGDNKASAFEPAPGLSDYEMVIGEVTVTKGEKGWTAKVKEAN